VDKSREVKGPEDEVRLPRDGVEPWRNGKGECGVKCPVRGLHMLRSTLEITYSDIFVLTVANETAFPRILREYWVSKERKNLYHKLSINDLPIQLGTSKKQDPS